MIATREFSTGIHSQLEIKKMWTRNFSGGLAAKLPVAVTRAFLVDFSLNVNIFQWKPLDRLLTLVAPQSNFVDFSLNVNYFHWKTFDRLLTYISVETFRQTFDTPGASTHFLLISR